MLGRGQKAFSRGQKAFGRGQKALGRCLLADGSMEGFVNRNKVSVITVFERLEIV